MLDNPLTPRGLPKNATIPPCKPDQERILTRLHRGEDPEAYFQDVSRQGVSQRRGDNLS